MEIAEEVPVVAESPLPETGDPEVEPEVEISSEEKPAAEPTPAEIVPAEIAPEIKEESSAYEDNQDDLGIPPSDNEITSSDIY